MEPINYTHTHPLHGTLTVHIDASGESQTVAVIRGEWGERTELAYILRTANAGEYVIAGSEDGAPILGEFANEYFRGSLEECAERILAHLATVIKINIDENGHFAGTGILRDGRIEDCPAILGSDDICEDVYDAIERAIASGEDSVEIGEYRWTWTLGID